MRKRARLDNSIYIFSISMLFDFSPPPPPYNLHVFCSVTTYMFSSHPHNSTPFQYISMGFPFSNNLYLPAKSNVTYIFLCVLHLTLSPIISTQLLTYTALALYSNDLEYFFIADFAVDLSYCSSLHSPSYIQLNSVTTMTSILKIYVTNLCVRSHATQNQYLN